ncbi:MAG: hypothetical protein WC633_00960 [Desulfurivibrionaceae bacterium]
MTNDWKFMAEQKAEGSAIGQDFCVTPRQPRRSRSKGAEIETRIPCVDSGKPKGGKPPARKDPPPFPASPPLYGTLLGVQRHISVQRNSKLHYLSGCTMSTGLIVSSIFPGQKRASQADF